MKIFDLHNSCVNIKSFCKYLVYRDFDSYCDLEPDGWEFSDSYDGLSWELRHDYDVISFYIAGDGMRVYVLIDMKECVNE